MMMIVCKSGQDFTEPWRRGSKVPIAAPFAVSSLITAHHKITVIYDNLMRPDPPCGMGLAQVVW
jgi:hypothetical protein